MFQRFKEETEMLINEAIEISYWSRGAVQYDSVYDMAPIERDQWRRWLKKRLEEEQKSPSPNY